MIKQPKKQNELKQENWFSIYIHHSIEFMILLKVNQFNSKVKVGNQMKMKRLNWIELKNQLNQWTKSTRIWKLSCWWSSWWYNRKGSFQLDQNHDKIVKKWLNPLRTEWKTDSESKWKFPSEWKLDGHKFTQFNHFLNLIGLLETRIQSINWLWE